MIIEHPPYPYKENKLFWMLCLLLIFISLTIMEIEVQNTLRACNLCSMYKTCSNKIKIMTPQKNF